MNKLCKGCKHTKANHPFYDGVGKIKCKQFILDKYSKLRNYILGK